MNLKCILLGHKYKPKGGDRIKIEHNHKVRVKTLVCRRCRKRIKKEFTI